MPATKPPHRVPCIEPLESRQLCSAATASALTAAAVLPTAAVFGIWKGNRIELTVGYNRPFIGDMLLHIDVGVATNIGLSDAQLNQIRHGHFHVHVHKQIRVVSSTPQGRLITEDMDYTFNFLSGGQKVTGNAHGTIDGHSINADLSLKKTSNTAPRWIV